jgi:hypothetical protein
MARNELKEAVQTAREALLLLGVRLPRKPSKVHVLPGLAHAMWSSAASTRPTWRRCRR